MQLQVLTTIVQARYVADDICTRWARTNAIMRNAKTQRSSHLAQWITVVIAHSTTEAITGRWPGIVGSCAKQKM